MGTPRDTVPSGNTGSSGAGTPSTTSIELGGVAALGLVILVVMAIGVGACRCDSCNYYGDLSCARRRSKPDADDAAYFCIVRELSARGAAFRVGPDGSATLRVPAHVESR